MLLRRDREQSVIDEALCAARSGRGEVLAIIGEAGVGKSALLAYAEDQLQIALLLAERRTTREAGAALFLSPKTVEAHVTAIFSKLDLGPTPNDHRRVLAVLTYLRRA